MARGWESKSVADQMDEAGARPERGGASYEASPVVRERRARVETLKLSRSRTLEQLNRATNPAHRAMLERAIGALEREIEELS